MDHGFEYDIWTTKKEALETLRACYTNKKWLSIVVDRQPVIDEIDQLLAELEDE